MLPGPWWHQVKATLSPHLEVERLYFCALGSKIVALVEEVDERGFGRWIIYPVGPEFGREN